MPRPAPVFRPLLALLLLGVVAVAVADDASPPLTPASWLVIEPVDAHERVPFEPDPVFHRYVLRRDAAPPRAGQRIQGTTSATWEDARVDADGRVDTRGVRWAHATVRAPRGGVWIAEIEHASTVFVNGTPLVGDVYGHGLARHPVRLEPGVNALYATGLRGACRIRFLAAGGEVFLADYDATLPDVVPGEPVTPYAAVLIVNASERTVRPLHVEATIVLDSETRSTGYVCPSLPPLGEVKVPLAFPPLGAPDACREARLDVSIADCDGLLDERSYPLQVRRPGEAHRRTFVSGIDGSVQLYAILPPSAPGPHAPHVDPGLVLTLHGASVDALGQVRAYEPKPDFWIVAPTNRRPFGFDWQDWGRLDAYEVLRDALAHTRVDRRLVHVTGHSMGGHGTLHLAANDPDGFASAAPSAAWISFATYGGDRTAGPRAALWRAADAASDTLGLLENLAGLPIHQLHGTADDNVPVEEAQALQAALEPLGDRYRVHYQPGAGHWWDGSEAGGADCVDWPPFFDLFRAASIPVAPESLSFLTADPAVDATHHWVRVEQLRREGTPARVRARRDGRTVRVETTNVRRIEVTPPAAWKVDRLEIDGQVPDGTASWRLLRTSRGWVGAPPPSALEKSPSRKGPFKRAFDRAFALVVGTRGTDEETRELRARVRYDAQRWRIKANGYAEVVTDTHLLRHPDRYADRNLVLYGNADTNAAWDHVFPATMPLGAERGRLRVGDRVLEGDDLAACFVYPRRGSDRALAGAVADTGPVGTRLSLGLRTFTSGIGYPDYTLFSPAVLLHGDGGVLAAGFFDVHWNLTEE